MRRVTSDSKSGRKLMAATSKRLGPGAVPHNTPHVGKKQLEKAKRRALDDALINAFTIDDVAIYVQEYPLIVYEGPPDLNSMLWRLFLQHFKPMIYHGGQWTSSR